MRFMRRDYAVTAVPIHFPKLYRIEILLFYIFA